MTILTDQLEYNTERDHLIIPEYGRHLQKMINHAENNQNLIQKRRVESGARTAHDRLNALSASRFQCNFSHFRRSPRRPYARARPKVWRDHHRLPRRGREHGRHQRALVPRERVGRLVHALRLLVASATGKT